MDSLPEQARQFAATDLERKLAARLAEAERDAARYRWLRERINWRDQFVPSEDGKGISTRWRAWVHDDYRESPPESEHIDEYIDGQLAADSADLSRRDDGKVNS